MMPYVSRRPVPVQSSFVITILLFPVGFLDLGPNSNTDEIAWWAQGILLVVTYGVYNLTTAQAFSAMDFVTLGYCRAYNQINSACSYWFKNDLSLLHDQARTYYHLGEGLRLWEHVSQRPKGCLRGNVVVSGKFSMLIELRRSPMFQPRPSYADSSDEVCILIRIRDRGIEAIITFCEMFTLYHYSW